jgi:hypothetical protein
LDLKRPGQHQQEGLVVVNTQDGGGRFYFFYSLTAHPDSVISPGMASSNSVRSSPTSPAVPA